MIERQKLCFVTAVPLTASAFLSAHLERLAGEYELFVVSNFSAGVPEQLARCAKCIHVPIQRKISVWADLTALVHLFFVMKRSGFVLVQSVTPKAGLLSMLAAWTAGIRVRGHWFTGQVWATKSGLPRRLLRLADWVTAALASDLLADSPSQRQFLLDEGVCRAKKIRVIADGSICGVDATRFRPDPEQRAVVRTRHSVPSNALLILYLGRLNRDKGLQELTQAISLVCRAVPTAHFLIVGPDEDGLAESIQMQTSEYAGQVHLIGQTNHPEHYFAAADVFCLPSYREGFGTVVIEAAAAGLPSVATRIYGLTDAIDDGVTGILVPRRDAAALAKALLYLLTNNAAREEMGRRARQRAITSFARTRIADGLAEHYRVLIRNA